MRRTWTLFLLTTLVITGCSEPQLAPKKWDSMDGGPKPTQYRHLIKNRIQEKYEHPEYLRNVSISNIKPGVVTDEFGWIACVEHQASNDGIKYTPPIKMLFLLRDNQVLKHGPVQEICEQPFFTYQPWPETKVL